MAADSSQNVCWSLNPLNPPDPNALVLFAFFHDPTELPKASKIWYIRWMSAGHIVDHLRSMLTDRKTLRLGRMRSIQSCSPALEHMRNTCGNMGVGMRDHHPGVLCPWLCS